MKPGYTLSIESLDKSRVRLLFSCCGYFILIEIFNTNVIILIPESFETT